MLNVSQWLDLYKFQAAIYSDYQLARRWQVPPSYICQYRSGRLWLPLACILEIAPVVGAEPLEIITALEYHRAPERHKAAIKRAYFDALTRGIGARMAMQNSHGYTGKLRQHY